jgi:hypothetical protein
MEQYWMGIEKKMHAYLEVALFIYLLKQQQQQQQQQQQKQQQQIVRSRRGSDKPNLF